MNSRKQRLAELVNELEDFRCCSPSDDPDEQTSVVESYRYLIKSLKYLAKEIIPPRLFEHLAAIDPSSFDPSSFDSVYDIYNAKVDVDVILPEILEVMDNPDASTLSQKDLMNYKVIATKVGELAKWEKSVNEIQRFISALIPCEVQEFPNPDITSKKAQLIYNTILSLADCKMERQEKNESLKDFCREVIPQKHMEELDKILQENLTDLVNSESETHKLFTERKFHPQVIEHCERLFSQGNYFHAVSEGCKLYTKAVQDKSHSDRDGHNLMEKVWNSKNGVLKLSLCQSLQTNNNIQDGIQFLSVGLMKAMRNPTAHEPALNWPINQQDCLDILSFLSFLFRQLDQAEYQES